MHKNQENLMTKNPADMTEAELEHALKVAAVYNIQQERLSTFGKVTKKVSGETASYLRKGAELAEEHEIITTAIVVGAGIVVAGYAWNKFGPGSMNQAGL